MSTLVSVGNAHQPFNRLVDAVIAIVDQLPQPVIVQHGHTPCTSKDIFAISFMDMDVFEETVSAASLLILHAGCGALINALRNDRIPVVMARRKKYNEHIDDHQLEIVKAMAKQKRIIRADTAEDLLDAVKISMNTHHPAKNQIEFSKAVPYVRKLLSKYALRAASK